MSGLLLPPGADESIILPPRETPFVPEILPGDGPTVARLKRESAEKLRMLPADQDQRVRVIGTKADFFAASSLRIRPKETEGGLAPFVYNPIQMDHLAGLRQRHRLAPGVDFFTGVRDIILKPRQLGFTTYLASLYFFDALFRPGRNTLVLTHLDKVSQKVLEIYRAFYDSLPEEIKVSVRLRRASALHLELEFLGADGRPDPVAMPPSSFMVHTAQGLDLRGVTVHNLHLSEAAFYDNWVELTRGIIQAVPTTGNITLESTANGFNHFKDLVDAALKGSGRYRLIFYPWFAHPEYCIDLTPEATLALEESLEEDERLLVLDHRLTLAQIAWRRMKLEEMSRDSFRQEYPGTVLDAFLSSGRPVFDARVVSANWDKAKEAPFSRPNPSVTVWAMPERGVLYLLCADPAEGIDKGEGDPVAEIGGTDYSSAYVLDSRNLRAVAAVHGRIAPVEFARLCSSLGHDYNDALLVVERNNHGHVVLFALEEAGYPNLYRHMEYDAAGTAFLKLGFPMTTATRPLVVDTLREVIARDSLPCSDPRFWGEAQVFVWGPDGKAAAMPTRHDDRVMSMAIGVYVATLGAKAWGGSGLLLAADGAGLPLPGAARVLPVPPTRPDAPAPLPLPTVAPAGADFAGAFPRAGAMLEPPPGPDGTPSAPHNALLALAAQREALAEPTAPCCGTCRQRALRNGVVICGLHGWVVKDTDPDCGSWDAPEESYNEGVVHRVSIGGVE